MQWIKKIFGTEPEPNWKKLVQDGAQIIDVRTNGEFASGHIPGSINIPLQNIRNNFSRIKKDKQVITCCASGMRSASARTLLKANGFKEVYNGGSWISLQNKIS